MRRIPLLNRVDEAMADMTQRLNETTYGQDADSRVRQLRRSILGDDAAPEPSPWAGLEAWLPRAQEKP